MPSKDVEKLRRWRREWYERNKAKQIGRQMDRRKELTTWLWEYKRTLSCLDCGFDFSDAPECLDFHHLDPSQKEGTVLEMAHSSRQAAEAELAKCVPLCANCHRTRHKGMYVNA